MIELKLAISYHNYIVWFNVYIKFIFIYRFCDLNLFYLILTWILIFKKINNR